MKIIRRVYVALSQNMFFLCKHLIFFRKGHFYQAMPADLRWEGSPFPPNRVKTTPKSILWFLFGNPLVSHLVNQLCSFWSCSCLPNGKLAHLKCFPSGKKSFLLFPKWGETWLSSRVQSIRTKLAWLNMNYISSEIWTKSDSFSHEAHFSCWLDLAIEQSIKYTNKTCLIKQESDFERNLVGIWLIFEWS